MESMAFRDLPVQPDTWNIFSKQDFLQISDLLGAQLLDCTTPEAVLLRDFSFTTLNSNQSCCSHNEFLRSYHPDTPYTRVCVAAHLDDLDTGLSFYAERFDKVFLRATSKSLTTAQLQDALMALEPKIMKIYRSRINTSSSPGLPDQVDDYNDDSHSCAHGSRSKGKYDFLKSSVFWTAAGVVIAAVGIAVTIFK